MRKLLLVLAITAAISIAWQNKNADMLTNTTWTGTLLVPDAMNATLSFTKDSLTAKIGYDVVETIQYSVKGDTIFMQKLSGTSPCGTEEGSYLFSVKDDVLYLKLINDDCGVRSGAFSPEGYKRSKD